MNKKELLSPFLLIALGLAFAFVSLAVLLSHGKSKKWIARKMKIGGILLSLSTVSAGSGCITCYDMPAPLQISINGSNDYDIEIDLDTGNVLKGTLYMPDIKYFSFSVSDSNNSEKQSGQLIPSDGEFGQQTEPFTIEIDNSLALGDYFLKIYDCKPEEQASKYPFKQFYMKIKND